VHAGVDPGCIVLDPGLGFGKRAEHNWPLLTHLADVGTLAGGTFPVLVGASRKRFLGNLLAGPDGTPRPFGDCDGATVAITALAAADAWCVRVHQVPLNADAVRVAAAWRDAAAAGTAGPPLPVVRGVTGRSLPCATAWCWPWAATWATGWVPFRDACKPSAGGRILTC